MTIRQIGTHMRRTSLSLLLHKAINGFSWRYTLVVYQTEILFQELFWDILSHLQLGRRSAIVLPECALHHGKSYPWVRFWHFFFLPTRWSPQAPLRRSATSASSQ